MQLSNHAKVTRVANAAAAAQTTVTSAAVEMRGVDACQFTVLAGAVTSGAAVACKVQGSADDSDWSDLAGTGQTIADDDDDKAFVLDVPYPRQRYLRCVVTRATQDAAIDGILAQQYLPQIEPVTHDTTTVGGAELTHAPATGTA